MTSPSEERLLGEYRLKELLHETPIARTWLAEQVSVRRQVLVDELKPEQASHMDDFIADVRAKAAVDHPLIGSVYEAVAEPGCCFFAHELLPGTNLEDRRLASTNLKPFRLAQYLHRIAEVHLQHENLGQATSPLGLHHVHLDDQGVVRLDNLVISGARTPDQSARDILHLGKSLPSLVADGQPGTTRMLTLLGWMRGEGIEQPVGWSQISEICGQIEHQLSTPLPPVSPTQHATKKKKKSPVVLVVAVCVLALTAAVALIMRPRPAPVPVVVQSKPSAAVLIPSGRHPTPDGTDEELQAFRISTQEVTIGEYADFMDTLETLSKDHRERTFDHEDQPDEKTSHMPDDWSAMFAAAKTGGIWNGFPVTLDSPVVGVDWWDGAAYAEWKHARLPTQEEWFAALRKGTGTPAMLVPSGWAPVSAETLDRTSNGLVGMAGSVCEWTRRPAANPANPLGERKWVIIGGSFLKPGSNALSREWTDNRILRRPDLGFRLVFDAN